MRLIILIVIILIVILCYYNFKNREGYDNMIPNVLRWSIYNSNTQDDFKKNWCYCKKICGKTGRSYLGCIQSCEDNIKDRLFYLRNNNYNQFV